MWGRRFPAARGWTPAVDTAAPFHSRGLISESPPQDRFSPQVLARAEASRGLWGTQALTHLTARVRPQCRGPWSRQREQVAWWVAKDQPGPTPAAQSRSPYCGDPEVQDLRLQNREGLCSEPGGSPPPPGPLPDQSGGHLVQQRPRAARPARSPGWGPLCGIRASQPRQGTGRRVTAPASCAKLPCPHMPIMSQPAAHGMSQWACAGHGQPGRWGVWESWGRGSSGAQCWISAGQGHPTA